MLNTKYLLFFIFFFFIVFSQPFAIFMLLLSYFLFCTYLLCLMLANILLHLVFRYCYFLQLLATFVLIYLSFFYFWVFFSIFLQKKQRIFSLHVCISSYCLQLESQLEHFVCFAFILPFSILSFQSLFSVVYVLFCFYFQSQFCYFQPTFFILLARILLTLACHFSFSTFVAFSTLLFFTFSFFHTLHFSIILCFCF